MLNCPQMLPKKVDNALFWIDRLSQYPQEQPVLVAPPVRAIQTLQNRKRNDENAV
jgi:hypothetical protein